MEIIVIKEGGKVDRIKLLGWKNSIPSFYSIMVKIGKLKKSYGRILLTKQEGINKQGGFFLN